MLLRYTNYFSKLPKVIESATHVNPEKMARGSALAVINSGTRFEKMVLKNTNVENKATKTNKPKNINKSFFVNLATCLSFSVFLLKGLTHLLV